MERKSRMTRIVDSRLAVAVLAATLATTASAGLFGHPDVQRPSAGEFGLGPRASANHTYVATLRPEQPLRLRAMQSVPVLITDMAGRPVANATIAVDGGMPEHGHGLPTSPRVERTPAAGVYEIQGVRFNMGGWWELKLAIESPAGPDTVTFNLGL